MERVDGSKIKYREISFSNPADNNRGIISFFGVPLSKFTDPKKDGNDFYRTIDISDEDLHYLTDKFGPYVVIIPMDVLGEAMEKFYEKTQISYVMGPAIYSDCGDNERMIDSICGKFKRLFYKDIEFKSQNEFRIVIDQNVKKEHYVPIDLSRGAVFIEAKNLRNIHFF